MQNKNRIYWKFLKAKLKKEKSQLVSTTTQLKLSIILMTITLIIGCTHDNKESKYLRWVGDSKFDASIDTTQFELCSGENRVKQYFHFDKGLQYDGEKKELKAKFDREYVPVQSIQSGLIRIRFIVNCKGETGRFRLTSSDLNYQEQVFDERISSQLLRITRSLNGWKIQSLRNNPRDYYQYLIFKIENGRLVDIMP